MSGMGLAFRGGGTWNAALPKGGVPGLCWGAKGTVQGAAAAGVGTSESSRVIIGPMFGVQPRTLADFRQTAADDGALFLSMTHRSSHQDAWMTANRMAARHPVRF